MGGTVDYVIVGSSSKLEQDLEDYETVPEAGAGAEDPQCRHSKSPGWSSDELVDEKCVDSPEEQTLGQGAESNSLVVNAADCISPGSPASKSATLHGRWQARRLEKM